ncbi:MAG: entericidin A/B family lipoprotein [Oceanospirillaceae bacterium]|nr:entericidin A/B family lipoprotein [Oceanospirillaceae bacterium]
MLLPSKILMTICFVLSISACSTIEGIGKDLKKGGQVIENAANNATN